ncbi:MAG: CoA-binding protein [Candidatus Lokiarchaeota archaeon]|nr:CoA-binding protein [Candidatus Harpocratesius repetitus]
MGIYQDLSLFFAPHSILIIGSSRNEYTANGIVLKNLLEARYHAHISIVHPYTKSLMGIPTINSIDEIGTIKPRPDLAIILTRHNLLEILETLGKAEIHYILLQTDLAYITTKEEYLKLSQKIKAILDKYHIKMLGPSMIGIIDFLSGFTSSIIPIRSHIIQISRKQGWKSGVSFLAQSGGLSGACGWWNLPQPVPFSKVFHIGKQLQITEAQMLEFLFNDSQTQVITLYMKKITHEFIDVMHAYRGKKPVLIKYVGKNQANFNEIQEAGAISVENYIELFEFAKLFLWCPTPQNDQVGIIGPSSGAINLLIAEMRLQGIHLASLHDENRKYILKNIGGSTCELGNPVDYWPPKEFIGTQVCQVYFDASKSLLKDPNVGSLFLALEFFTEIEFDFGIFKTIKRLYPDKPIITILIQAEEEGAQRIVQIGNELHIPVFVNEVERGVRALKIMLKYHKLRNSKN